MWGASEEPPGTMEGDPPEPMTDAKTKCEQNKSQLESLKEIMLRNKQSLKKKEEEVQEYARRLSKIKSRAKLSRRSKEGSVPPKDATQLPKSEGVQMDVPDETIDDISQAKTPKAKSTLLQKKLAENRKAFEQRSKEITETKRAVEEKVEAIRQQLEEKDATITASQKDQLSVIPVRPIMITSDVMSPIQIGNIQEKENKIIELSNKILELEATVLDLQENLKEKDSVIESKTKAVTLMSADLSKKGKTTLDTLEDTKDEMRTMQEHFVLLETSLKSKNDNLLEQLQERDNKVTELEETVRRFEQQVNEQKQSEAASVDFSRSTMDALVEAKDAMKSMQENFVLIESSLKVKNDNLLQQLNEYEVKLAEANERVFQLESGIGIVKDPAIDDLRCKIDKLEYSNKQLQDEKYELQKSVAEMQDKIVSRSVHSNGAMMEKDNRIAELENLVEELKQSNKLLEEESKSELQKQLSDLTLRNDEYSNKITDLEKLVHELEAEKNDMAARLPDENSATKEDEKVAKLTKELEELNKTMIKIKAQHKSKVKNLQKQLENFKMVSDTNAELVKLGNQVALLEEEKGNLQLSLVDFDELKASAGDWQERIADLETKVSAQTKEIQMHIDAIAILENQKLDLTQELHSAKQEVSALESENAESENLRVTAEMKVVDLEEQLESLYRAKNENRIESSEANHTELLRQIELLTQENAELYNKVTKLEEKGASDTGSTESFETIQESDKSDLLKKIEDLTQKNNELTLKLNKLEEKGNSHVGSTESFESINDTDKNELLKKIDQLTQENTDLTLKLSRIEEKGSSDTGSTESFERIPEHSESMTKIELLTQENSELVIKLTKLEEQLEYIAAKRVAISKSDDDTKLQIETLLQENSNQSLELTKLKAQVSDFIEENKNLQKEIENLTMENNDLAIMRDRLEENNRQLETEPLEASERPKREIMNKDHIDVLMEEKNILEKEVKELRNALEQSQNVTSEAVESHDLKSRVDELLEENNRVLAKVAELEEFNEKLQKNLNEVAKEKEELCLKMEQPMSDDFAKERLELIDKLEKLNQEKLSVAQERQGLHEQISTLLHKSNEELSETRKMDESVSSQQAESTIVASLEHEIEECKKLIAEQNGLIEEMKIKLAHKEEELEEKGKLILQYESSGQKAESLETELKEVLSTVEEMRYKCNEMQEKMQVLEARKEAIEEGFKKLQNENEILLEEQKEKERATDLLKQELENTIASLESRLQENLSAVSEKDNEIASLKNVIEEKDREVNAKYLQLQNEMIVIDNLQDELNSCKTSIQDKDATITSLSDEIANLNNVMRSKEEEIYALRRDNTELNENLRESKPLKAYNELLEELKTKDMILNEINSKMNVTLQEKNDLLEKVHSLSQTNSEIQNQIAEKQQELTDLVKAKEHLDAQLIEIQNDKSEGERRVWELQNILDNNAKFVEDLQKELKNGYKQIEQLKVKHTEDIEMQNQRLETLIEELNAKTEECLSLKGELEEKEKLVGQNVTEEMKIALEAEVLDLKQKLTESEDKIQAQLEKMKKIAATLKKKTVICQELEARVVELEEKWTTEKDEKEAKNKRIQEVEISMREKDNKIADLEEKLTEARNETVEALRNIEKLTSDVTNSKEKISLLTEQIIELENEIVKLREDVETITADLAMEKGAKENILAEFESYKKEVTRENERKELELDEVKEQARELSVRMQVMEAEYVEQLALIKNLQAENGLLLSKQTQINEELENVEKVSEERRMLIEGLQKEIVNTATTTTQTSEQESSEDDTRISGVQHCDHCEQCQTLVQALEAKLQEREAEIENLDNELANSIGNFVQMRESLRFSDLMNQTSMRNRSLEDPYNDLLFQYNTLMLSHEEIKTKLDNALKENEELMEKVETLQSANTTLEEKVVAVNQELNETKERTENLQSIDLTEKYEEREMEFSNLKKELETIQEHANQLEQQLHSQAVLFDNEKEQLLEKEKLLVDAKNRLEQEIESLKVEQNSSQKRIDDLETKLELNKQEVAESTTKSAIVKRDVSAFERTSDEQDNVPQLFDASKIFGTPFAAESDILGNKELTRLQTLLKEKELQCSNLTQEIDHMQRLMVEERTQMLQNYSQCSEELKISQDHLYTARAELEKQEQLLTERNRQIDALRAELNNVSLQITAQHEQQNDTDKKMKEEMFTEDSKMDELIADLNSTKEALKRVEKERDQQNHLLESYKLQVSNLETELRNSTDSELIQELEERILSTSKEKHLLQLQVNDLSTSMEELKDTVEARRNLQVEIEKAIQERNEAKELAANLTQALEDYRKSSMDVAHTTLEGSTILPKQSEQEIMQPVEENIEQVTHSNVGSSWDAGSSEKLNIDEETWDWNADEVQLTGDQHLTTILVPSTEVQLRARIDDLQDQIKDLEAEKEKLVEENKSVQVRSGKMIKKLKEYKVQIDNLQQQLKLQKSTSDFYELDSAIEEELKSQINKLEKTLSEAKNEQKNIAAEKEVLVKRLDVVVSANERYMEMKERQDIEMDVLRIRNKELTDKLDTLEKRLQEKITSTEGSTVPQTGNEANVFKEDRPKRSIEGDELEAIRMKYKDEIDDLKDEMEALASENEQLQQFLAEQKTKLSSFESKRVADENDSIQIVDELNKRILELQGMLSKSKEEYDTLRKQYEQSLMDANDQVSAMRQNADFLKGVSFEKISKLEMEINDLRQQLEASDLKVIEYQKNLQDVSQEKESLEEKVTVLTTTSEKQLSSINASMAEVTDLLNIRIQEVADLKQELQKQYIDHEEVKTKLQTTIQELMQELGGRKQELENLRQSFTNKEQELIQQQSVETVSALVSEATQELVQKHAIEIEERDKEIRKLNERLSTLQITVDEHLSAMQSQVVKIDIQQQELEHLQENLVEKDSAINVIQSDLIAAREELITKQSDLSGCERELQRLALDNQRYLGEIGELQKRLNESETTTADVHQYTVRIQSLEEELQGMTTALTEKTSSLNGYEEESREYKAHLENNKSEINELRMKLEEVDVLRNEVQQKTEQINYLNVQLEAATKSLEETRQVLNEKTSLLETTNQMLNAKQTELNRLSGTNDQQQQGASNIIDGLPVFRMSDESENLKSTVNSLQVELIKKQEEIENLKYILNENTYPNIIREMQERINCLYDTKAELESSLEMNGQRLTEKEKEVEALKHQMEIKSQESVSKEELNLLSRERRSVQGLEEIVRLQNELHIKEQEINELNYIIADKDSQLSLQASMEPPSDDFELRQMVERLTAEVYSKEQEIQHLKSTITELQKEVMHLQEFKILSEESKEAIEKLTIEKEHIRVEAEEFLQRKLQEKEAEIAEIKQRLSIENRSILDELQLRDKDIENLKRQLEEACLVEQGTSNKLREREEELLQANSDLAEKERRLAELSITKDAELHNLKVQIHEKEVRIEELLALSEEEEKQLAELRNSLESRETEINSLKKLLETKVKEYELIENALKKDVPIIDTSANPGSSGGEGKESTSQELDLALYMLHQRDVRCEELTHELMQLLEERDTLQLRLSNAIKVNEDLRRVGNFDCNPEKETSPTSGSEEPLVEHPSPSRSEGPVEIAKEAIDAPIGEDKETLALKLSQLHTVSHAKDVRLRDERELRHTQQMSLLAHKDVLSTLPPEAAARLVNANYTLSRDVQSQSSVLLNWLWGKSTPKVVHM